MEDIFDFIEAIDDPKSGKVHKLKDIVVIGLFATLANADDWVKIEIFVHSNEQFDITISIAIDYSLKKKRFALSCNFYSHIEALMSL